MSVNPVNLEGEKEFSYIRSIPQSQKDEGLPPEASRIIRIAQEISEKRQRLLRQMRAALMAGQNEVVVSVAKELCGLTESASSEQQNDNAK